MKNSISKIIAILFLGTIFASCSAEMFNSVNGNRNVVTKNRKTSNKFNGIKVSTGIDLHLNQGSKNKVTVEADENLHDIIITEVKDGVLKIYSEKSIWKAKARKVYVTIKDLTLLKATSGSNVYGKGIIKTNEISISSTSGADIRITVNATSGSSIDAYGLESENVIVNATSGADINIYASKKLDAKANSGADIDFKGNPKYVNKTSSSGGDISKI